MRKFISTKEYYIHEYQAICHWFGNRGVEIKKGDLKEWCYDGHYFYFTCTKKSPEIIRPCDGDSNVMVCVLDSICYECDHEMEYEKSPFANKVTP